MIPTITTFIFCTTKISLRIRFINIHILPCIYDNAPLFQDGMAAVLDDSSTYYYINPSDWKDTGGTNSTIKPYQRNEAAGSQALMVKLVMKDTPFMRGPETYLEETMEGLVMAISAYNNGEFAIGYNVYYYVTKMKDDENVKMLAVDDVTPEYETIAGGQYPFVNDFYVVVRKDAPRDSSQRKLFEWIQSAEGKALIDLEGYVVQK